MESPFASEAIVDLLQPDWPVKRSEKSAINNGIKHSIKWDFQNGWFTQYAHKILEWCVQLDASWAADTQTNSPHMVEPGGNNNTRKSTNKYDK